MNKYKLIHCFCTNGRISKNEIVINNFVVLFLFIKKTLYFLINLKQLNQTFNNLEVINLKTFLFIVSSFKSNSTNLSKPDIFHYSLFIFLISILLIFKKSKILIKKLILVNFVLISFYLWYLQINNINVNEQFHIYKYFGLNDLNLINVFILIAIEISYFTWSFLSYKTNLSDWIVFKPQKSDFIPLLNMFIFYFFIIIYYSILT